MGSRSHVQIVIQAERFGSKHTGRKRIKSGNHILHRYKQVANINYSIHINAVIVTNVHSIEKLLHGNYCGVMSTRILEIHTGENPYQCSYSD